MREPFLRDPDVTLYLGDALEVLAEMPDGSVDCCVTSPPYWGLRDYGTGAWEGGNKDCGHVADIGARASSGLNGSLAHKDGRVFVPFRDVCGNCGARRVDNQLGLEATPDLYVARMVELFREVRRVLADRGTCWLNLGDSYASNWPCSRRNVIGEGSLANGKREARPPRMPDGLKEKDLVGIPWRVAFALQADGWYLRSDIIWSKPNPMPESVTDRPTKAHEFVFLLSKQPRYFFDQEAVREPAEWERWGDQTNRKHEGQQSTAGWIGSQSKRELVKRRTVRPGIGINGGGQGTGAITLREGQGRNVRSVWEIATQPFPEAHFATFPEELVRRCILAGCPIGGVVLDPFMGSGTTALVARKHGRRSIGIDLNADYCRMAARRLQQLSLLAEPA